MVRATGAAGGRTLALGPRQRQEGPRLPGERTGTQPDPTDGDGQRRRRSSHGTFRRAAVTWEFTMPPPLPNDGYVAADEVEAVAEVYRARLHAGERPDRQAYLRA